MAELRARTTDDHARVDAAFSAYDLADREDYCAFLGAHARALPAAEVIAATVGLPFLRTRTPLLRADMQQLGLATPDLIAFDGADGEAFAWGVRYVVEGSRMGGAILAKRVAAELPTTYLAAIHQLGEWRRFGETINAEARRQGAAWLDRAVVGAGACFALYRHAARPDTALA